MRAILLCCLAIALAAADPAPGAGIRIVLIAANPAVATTTGWPVGFWAAELTHPYEIFRQAGCHVTIASPAGGPIVVDAWSHPDDPSGYAKDDAISRRLLADPAFQALLAATPAVKDLDPLAFDAVVVVGGQSPMFTFAAATDLHTFFTTAERSGRVVAALCHGTALLLYLTKPDGSPYVQGLRFTGFANSEEDAAEAVVGQKLMPFRIEDEARRLGADFVVAEAFAPHAIRTGTLITGQQQHSGHAVAELVLHALAER